MTYDEPMTDSEWAIWLKQASAEDLEQMARDFPRRRSGQDAQNELDLREADADV